MDKGVSSDMRTVALLSELLAQRMRLATMGVQHTMTPASQYCSRNSAQRVLQPSLHK